MMSRGGRRMPTDGGSGGFRLDLTTEEEQRLRARAKMRARQETNRAQYVAHPWPFLRDCVWTLDQATGRERPLVDDLPDDLEPRCSCAAGGCTNYLHHVVNRLAVEKRVAVPKSRRMRMSWTVLAYATWFARFRGGSNVAVISRKLGRNDSEGSAELVKRCRFILDHLPIHCPEEPFTYDFGRIKFPRIQSEIIAMAQGADQLRQYTISLEVADEIAFWERAGETYNASMPTLEGGGQLIMLSSANPGFFKSLVFDELHAAGTGFRG